MTKDERPPLPWEGSKELWMETEIHRKVSEGDWRYLPNYTCLKCGENAFGHPYTTKIWGCKKCDFTTPELATHFHRIESEEDRKRANFDFFDYVIYCQARSGSHLLASLLNSHPDLACEGEVPVIGVRDPARGYSDSSWDVIKEATGGILPPPGKIRGCICHYINSMVFAVQEGYRPKKWIHLLRNPERVARSLLRRWAEREDGSARAHYFQGEEVPPEKPIDLDQLKQQTQNMENLQHYNIEFLRAVSEEEGLEILQITYEDLTQGSSIYRVRNITTKKILEFLGVKEIQLETRMVKVSK